VAKNREFFFLSRAGITASTQVSHAVNRMQLIRRQQFMKANAFRSIHRIFQCFALKGHSGAD